MTHFPVLLLSFQTLIMNFVLKLRLLNIGKKKKKKK